MSDYSFNKVSKDELKQFKQHYRKELPAPLDGMWGVFVDMADHYSIICEDETIGYVVINPEQKILQFHLTDGHNSDHIFRSFISVLKATGAFVATCEPNYLALCLGHKTSVKENALMYQIAEGETIRDATFPPNSNLKLVEASALDSAVEFGIEAIGADAGWLRGYYCERIARGELFGLWQDNQLIAAGECRVSDTQKPFADVGMIVSEKYRGHGLATNILRQLVHICNERSLKAICSTEMDNIAAQRAITKAGFTNHHKILEISFKSAK